MKKNEFDIIKSLEHVYKIALAVIGILATLSCLILVTEITQNESNSRIINMSGRQRMLSQNIVKNILLLNNNFSDDIKERSREELTENFSLWLRVHQALQNGDTALRIPKLTLSPTIRSYFKEIDPYFNSIAAICKIALINKDTNNAAQTDIENLLNNEKRFLGLMDKITFQFDWEAKSEIVHLKKFEIFFWLLTLFTLLIEGLFIFKPITILARNKIIDYNMLFDEKRKQEIESLSAIVETEENERTRIANEMHDGIVPMLVLVNINLSSLANLNNRGSEAGNIIENTKQAISQIITDLRNISYNLMPASLRAFGLAAAIDEIAEKIKLNDGIKFKIIKYVQRETFGSKIDVNVYRMLQELLNNILKYSGATEVVLQLIEHKSDLAISLETNGVAYDPVKGYNKIESRGLKNVASRIKSLNGSVEYDTLIDGKIMIMMSIPL